MINFFKKRLSIRKGFITGVILLVLFNLLFITGYYRLVLSTKIRSKQQVMTNEIIKEVKNLSKDLMLEENISNYLNEYAKENNVKIELIDENNNVYKSYEPNHYQDYNTVVSNIINVNGKYYLLSISKEENLLDFRVIIGFLFFEFIILVLLALTGIFGVNFKILGPITSLSKDFNNYKLNILPKRRKINGEIGLLQNDFVDLVETLEDEKKKQNRIIASISHDIKTPLTSILGYSERLLTNSKLSDETKNIYAQKIYNQAISLKEITEEFDDYLSSHINDNNKLEKISIKYIRQYLNNYYKEDLKEKNIDLKIKTNCPNSLIFVDIIKFKRIFSNTITNSIRYLNKNKNIINININTKKDDKIIFEIADNGTGIKESDLEKIFEPLYTTDKSRKISGLGLSICKEIVESLGGSIKAVNNKMGGLSIIFTIDEYKEK